MKIIHESIRSPVTTTVGVLLLVLFGLIALWRLPVQLTPAVEEPEITVTTVWAGASPHEIEREIIDEQEEQLKSLEGLVKMESSSSDSSGSITLSFRIGTDLDSALIKVSNRLEQVQRYPEDAEKPVIRTVDVNTNAVGWFILAPIEKDGFEGDISTLYDFVQDYIKPEFERVPGVATSLTYGGREHEMHVVFDPAAMAARGITQTELAAALERENRNYSAGGFDEGKRRYVVRTVGEYRAPEDIDNIVVAVRNEVPVYLRDIGHAELGYQRADAKVFMQGRQVLAMNAIREPGSNVMDVMAALKETIARLETDLLKPRGLRLVQVYDETDYIGSAISLVRISFLEGSILAVVVLLLFLRSFTSTLVISVAIPITVIGTFLMMLWFGRTMNVISLAGIAFSVGMGIDNSIVVLENIYRHRQMGKSLFQAAYDGASEVWGAVLASTLTNIAIFVPVIFVKEEAGQLFGDIAIAVSCSVFLSLIVSITVIPCMAARILHAAEEDHTRRGHHNLWGLLWIAERATVWITDTVHAITGSTLRRVTVVVVTTVVSLAGSWWMMPKAEYLPVGNNNFLFGIMLPPPGYSIDEVVSLHDILLKEVAPLWQHEAGSPEAEALPGGGVRGFFFVALNNLAFMGARANDGMRVAELMPEFMRVNALVPGAIVVVQQASIFQRGLGEGRNIDIELTGPDLERLIALGGSVFRKIPEVMPGAQARPIPSLDLGNPELQVSIHRQRAAELGLSNRELGFAVAALVEGAKATDYQFEGREIDVKVIARHSSEHRTHLFEQMPIATPAGQVVTLGAVASVEVSSGPVEIHHRERQRAITIQVTPPEKLPLESAMEAVERQILDPLRASGDLGGLYQVRLSGTADKLAQTGGAMYWNFLLASVLTYLLMAALFESFLHPLVIMFSVPSSALGGFLGLWAVNTFLTYQALDVLTMLGFIILVGTVTNNAILIVHQALIHMREDRMEVREAIREATRTRVRPIFMSVFTCVAGMLPLVVSPGAGSEIYRGLGAVVLGGLLLSTLVTLFVIPALFSLALDAQAALGALARRLMQPARPESTVSPEP